MIVGNTVAIAPNREDDGPLPPASTTSDQTRAPVDASGVADDFVAMFEQHYARVVRALELSGLDRAAAEDASQEAFARTLGHWARVRTGTNPPGYVFRTAFRLAHRQLGRRREDPLDPNWSAPDDALVGVATRLDVERALAAMPVRRRACAVLCLVVGLSTKEAARSLGIAEGTVRKQLERARADLRMAMDEGVNTAP